MFYAILIKGVYCDNKNMNIKQLLGKRIKELRKKQKLTQEKLAEIIGIDTVSLCNIENGKYYPTAENLDKILLGVNASPNELFHFEHHQEIETLKKEINIILDKNPDKIRDFYKIIKALTN